MSEYRGYYHLIQGTSTFLDNHWARNQILRTAQFATAMVSGILENASPDTAGKLLAVSSKISGVRVVLRLMDDIPTLALNISSTKLRGRSLSERVADLLLCLVNQLYYPAEHIAWAADQGLLPVESSRFWLLSNILWATSLVVSLLRTLSSLRALTRQIQAARSNKASSEDDVAPTNRDAAIIALRRQWAQTLAGAVQILSDLVLAVHWMPRDFPGGGCLNNLWLGFFGLTSSLIGLHRMVPLHKS